MATRDSIREYLNVNARKFGTGSDRRRDPKTADLQTITEDDALDAGNRHGCPVIMDVLTKRPPGENWQAYELKNKAYSDIADLFVNVDRPDLYRDWTKGELRKKSEHTHKDLRSKVQFPDQQNQRQLVPVSRIPQFYVADLLKSAALNEVSGHPELSLSVEDFTAVASSAVDIHDFCSSVAVNTARILKARGVPSDRITSLLVNSFAKTGTIREYGQQHPASAMVDDIAAKIAAAGDLPGLSSEFKQRARPLVRRFYRGVKNPRLH